MKVQTKAIHFSADKKLLKFIQKKVQKLEQFFDRIVGVEVVMKLDNGIKTKNKIVEIYLKVPGNTIVTKETQRTFEAAVDSSIPVLARQLQRYKQRARAKRA